uniref:Uncharacterized protein n=1 Tax=Parascaris univalens TaxID=6257 RepID=A0A915BAY7_PARUN
MEVDATLRQTRVWKLLSSTTSLCNTSPIIQHLNRERSVTARREYAVLTGLEHSKRSEWKLTLLLETRVWKLGVMLSADELVKQN